MADLVLAIQANADSPTQPGKKSVLVTFEPGVTYEAFMDAFTSANRKMYPLTDQYGDAVKEIQTKEPSSHEVEIKVIEDGRKLDRWHAGKGDGTDKLQSWWYLSWNLQEKSFKGEHYQAGVWLGQEKRRIQWSWTGRFIREQPLLVFEGSHSSPGEPRLAGDAQAFFFGMSMNPIARLMKDKVEIIENLVSTSSAESAEVRSAISFPLDTHTTYDALFQRIVDLGKIALIGAGMAYDESPNGYTGKYKNPMDGIDRTVKFEHDKEKGLIDFYYYRATDLVESMHKKLHRKPLILESWLVRDGKRESGWWFAKMKCQRELNDILSGLQSSIGIPGMDGMGCNLL
mmetsp:Transcript_9900/g.22177  ORF Transcript_9900/g.22177 Transcript_9900/m.22177 type:complete len:343 (-) Transcript_9900:140-1168(-)